MKFGKKFKDLQNTKIIEPQAITGINRLVCTSKSHNVELKGLLDSKFFKVAHNRVRELRKSPHKLPACLLASRRIVITPSQ